MATPRFFLTYLRRELRRRARQALLTALGLGLGVGLVMTVSAASAGVGSAQAAVLKSLYGVGTQVAVTEPALHPGALQDLGALLSGNLEPMPSASTESVSALPHVLSAAGGLRLAELKQSGGVWARIRVDGTDAVHPDIGPLAAGTIVSGHGFVRGDDNAAVIDTGYATANGLSVGSTIKMAGTGFTVIGIVRQPQTADSADVYIPLGPAQRLARSSSGKPLTDQVNVIYAAADSSSHVKVVQREILQLLPFATVGSAGDLATTITGSLQGASTLVGSLGRWVAVAALVASVAFASLLTIATVARRVREFGTLKALGWTTGRITGQIMGESTAAGLVGATVGVAAGFAGANLVTTLAPALSATVPLNDGSGQNTTIAVHLTAQVSPTVAATAALLAISGALLAGALGTWRAARLQPADAFARIA